VKSRFGRREVFRSMSRIAAIVVVAFLIILLDRQIRHPQEAPEVLARITGMEAAQWANADKTYQVGQDLVSQILNLKAGLVELTFSDGAEVILEAPVEVTINKTEEIFLQKGKVTVTASGTAVGFAVNTDNARVVDLGTEFGVSVNASGVTDIHVYQGEVALIAGWQRNMFNNASKPRINIIKGQARRVAADQSVREIPHNEIAFVRKDDFKIRQKTLAGDPYYRWRAQGLFLADEDTLHLYHFDVGITDVIRTDPIDLTLANGAILANASTVGFITALNTYDGLPSQEGPAAYKNDIPISSFVGADGAFTFEAIIKPTMPLESLTHKMFIIVGDDITGHRGWHFDIALQDNIWQLGFTNIVPSVVKYYTAIPTTGEHVYTAESWYHVAVTYNGRDNTADNLKLYWTRLDSGAATAQELDSFQMAVDLTPAVTTNFCIGNEWRENLGLSYYNFEGLIGAVRISKISRRADNMMFGVSVSPALGAGESGRRYAP
ncbi:MAG: FecR domain-containing protein, partial [Sedimentisphaerales bacterium]|nr:FecR domain-containing protein [Sedimentisphaerales bacterium]